MAITEYYVTRTGTDTWANATSIGTPCSLATAFANCKAGERANVKYDATAYSIGATTWAFAGTVAALTMMRGYNTNIGDLEGKGRNAVGELDTTNFPEITLTGKLVPSSRSLIQNLNISGSLNSALVGDVVADGVCIVGSRMENSSSGSSAIAFQSDNLSVLINSDFVCSGTVRSFVVDVDNDAQLVGCRFSSAGTDTSALVIMRSGSCVQCLFIGTGVENGLETQVTAAQYLFLSNTFYKLSTGLLFPNGAFSSTSAPPPILIDNAFTDCGVGIDGVYTTAPNAILEFNSRTRGNTNARLRLGDGLNVGEIIANNGTPSDDTQDYVNASGGNLRLISGAEGESAGLIAYSDVGAYQREPAAGGGSGGGAVIIGSPIIRGVR